MEPTNGELSLMIKDLARELRSALTRIEIQTTKTNGRVTMLEDMKNKLVGALIFTNIVLIPFCLILFSNYLSKK
jgi:hypothetical protein